MYACGKESRENVWKGEAKPIGRTLFLSPSKQTPHIFFYLFFFSLLPVDPTLMICLSEIESEEKKHKAQNVTLVEAPQTAR